MNSLSGFNSQEIRRLHPYLSALRRRLKEIETGKIEIRIEGGGGGGGNIAFGTDDDILPTGDRNSGGSLNRVARADHQHLFKFPTTVPASTPDGSAYFDTSASAIRVYVGNTATTRVVAGGTAGDVQPTGTANTGTAPRYSFADHSHPTALLPQSNSQSPVANEIRFSTDNKVVRWNGSAWTDLTSALPVPADPLILPYDTQVSSPQSRQLVNRNAWDNIGDATVFYRDANSNQYRLIFARPLATSTTSTPTGKDVWTNTADELVLKEGTGFIRGSVLWRRRGNTQDWSPVSVQLLDEGVSFPTDVGVLIRSALTGTSGSRRWFIRGVQEDGSFRAPLAGIATFTASTTPAPTDFATNLGDGYAYFIHDLDRVDIIRPTTGGNTAPTMLPHYVIAPPCRVFSTATDSSGHYVRDEVWNGMWVIRFYTTASATTDLTAVLPTIAVPFGIQTGRVMLYLYNPQSSAISTVFSVAVRRPTNTTPTSSITSDTTISIPANTAVVANLGLLSFTPNTNLSHNRSHILSISVIRRRTQEASNANSVMCLGVVVVPERA